MHNSTSERARAIVKAIEDLENEDPILLTIDMREIIAAGTKKYDSVRIAALELVHRKYNGLTRFVHLGLAFAYQRPIRLYDYGHIKEWKRVDKLMKSVEQQARESLKAKEQGLDITGMMKPAKFKMRKEYISVLADGSGRRYGPWLRSHKKKEEPDGTGTQSTGG